MTWLWVNLAAVFFISFLSRYFSVPAAVSGAGLDNKPNKYLTAAAVIVLVLVSGLRNGIGDTPAYKKMFMDLDYKWNEIASQSEMGFVFLQMVLKSFTSDPQILIFTCALITNILIVSVFYHYSKRFELSAYVYITGGLYLVSMNGMRQLLAAAICFAAIKFLLDGKFLKYAFVVLLASTLHQSALLLIPMYFIVRIRAWSKSTVILLLSSIAIVAGYETFSKLLFEAIQSTKYQDYANFNEGGANLMRIAVAAAPLAVSFLGREKLRAMYPKIDIIINMSLIGLVFMIISTQQWIFARMAIYFNLYQLILISWIIEVFSSKDRKFIYYIVVSLYFIFYYYESVISLDIIYTSDIIESLFF